VVGRPATDSPRKGFGSHPDVPRLLFGARRISLSVMKLRQALFIRWTALISLPEKIDIVYSQISILDPIILRCFGNKLITPGRPH
jgi:hypothetical protein